jgi:hypothetical protein
MLLIVQLAIKPNAYDATPSYSVFSYDFFPESPDKGEYFSAGEEFR